MRSAEEVRSGDMFRLTSAASVQFARPILFNVTSAGPSLTSEDWVWLDGYELDVVGKAVAHRSVFVQLAGLQLLSRSPD